MGLHSNIVWDLNMSVNLSKPPKKRIIKNKIFVIIFIIYISSLYILDYIYSGMIPMYIIIPLGIIGIVMMANGLSRYIDYEKSKYKKINNK